MRALHLSAPRQLEVVDVPDPVPQHNEALIRLECGGICGSDVSVYRGDHPFRKPPVVLGHEVAGEVVSVGRDLAGISVGDRVAVEPQIVCGHCHQCLSGRPNLCRNKKVVGVHWPGMFSEYIAAPQDVLYPLAPSTTFEQGALIEPSAVAVRAVRLANIGPASSVAVLGVGAIGSLVVRVCAAAGASDLLATDVRDYNLERLKDVAHCTTVNVRTTEVDRRQSSGNRGFDAVVVATGSRSSLSDALALVKPGGTVVVVALYNALVDLDPNQIVTQEICVQGALTYTSGDFRAAASLINNGIVDVESLVSHRFELGDGPELFRRIDEGSWDHSKVILSLSN
jgi:L-iditol 2-dehydrogenase